VSMTKSMTGLAQWRAYMKFQDCAALRDLLHPDAVFESTPPQRGRDTTFKSPSSGERRSEDGAVLEFDTEIEGIGINGADIFRSQPLPR
jgi:hypothetical protein